MRILVCGDRHYTHEKLVIEKLGQFKDEKEVVIIEGGCVGADIIARSVAQAYGYKVEEYPAQWSKYGRAAGPIRNKQMIDEGKPDLVIAFHDNIDSSRGTKGMIAMAQKAGIKTILIEKSG